MSALAYGKGRKFVWTNESQKSFEKLKSMLVQAPIIAHPDFSKPFIIDTDTSNKAIGGVLLQVIDGREQVIAYASRTLSKQKVGTVSHGRNFLLLCIL